MILPGRSRHRWEIPSITAVLALAAVLRFANLSSRGLIYWDEGKFALEGIRIEAGLRALFGLHANLLTGKAVGTAKPTHALLIALAYGVLGIHDYAPLFMDALASVISVGLTYMIGRRVLGPAVALVGALLLATSEYDVIYARSALSENDATVFLVAGVALWLSHSRQPDSSPSPPSGPMGVLLPGLLFGVGFTVNYRLIIYIAVIVAIDLAWTLRKTGLRFTSVRILAWSCGLLLAPVAWQIVGLAVQSRGAVFFRGEVDETPMSYVREVFYQLHGGKQSVFHFQPQLYLQWWVVRQGWLASLVLLGGFLFAAWRRTFPWLVLALPVMIPYLIYVFAPFVVPRNLAAALPFASLLTAAAIAAVASALRAYRFLAVVTAAALLGIIGGAMSWRLTVQRSGFISAAHYVTAYDGGRALTSSEIMVFYLRDATTCTAAPVPYTVGDLEAAIRARYGYAILERHNTSPITQLIRRVDPRVARYSTLGPLRIGESPISSENSNPPGSHASAEFVDVYRLLPRRLPRSAVGTFTPCQLDEVT